MLDVIHNKVTRDIEKDQNIFSNKNAFLKFSQELINKFIENYYIKIIH